MNKENLKPVVYVKWEESERNWGVRPDGCSLHKTVKDFKNFEKKYWDEMPARAPYEYSRPSSDPTKAYASEWLYREIEGNGIFINQDREFDLKSSKSLVIEKSHVEARK
jgi:hypothetical protein